MRVVKAGFRRLWMALHLAAKLVLVLRSQPTTLSPTDDAVSIRVRIWERLGQLVQV
jgi:hypothetical protein